MWRERIAENKLRIIRLIGLICLIGVAVGGVVFQRQIEGFFKNRRVETNLPEVMVPTIIEGELVLPKVLLGSETGWGGSQGRLFVASANLSGVFDQQTQKLAAIRIFGEMRNDGAESVTGFSSRFRFFDATGKEVGQKIGRLTPGYDFFGLREGGTTYYDILVDDPPESDKLEIVLNPSVSSGQGQLDFEEIEIASRSMEVKTALRQAQGERMTSTESGEASESAAEESQELPEKVEYYTIDGTIINELDDSVTEIAIYAWVKNAEGKVFSFGRQDFKNDLLSPGQTIDFWMTLLPFKEGQEMASYEVAGWGKRYEY